MNKLLIHRTFELKLSGIIAFIYSQGKKIILYSFDNK